MGLNKTNQFELISDTIKEKYEKIKNSKELISKVVESLEFLPLESIKISERQITINSKLSGYKNVEETLESVIDTIEVLSEANEIDRLIAFKINTIGDKIFIQVK